MPGHAKPRASDRIGRTPATDRSSLGHASNDASGLQDRGSFASNKAHQALDSPNGSGPDGKSYYDLGDASKVAVDHGVSLPEHTSTSGETGTWDEDGSGGYTTLPPGEYGGMVELQQDFGMLIDSLVPRQVGGSMSVKAYARVAAEVVEAGVKVSLDCERTEDGFEISGAAEIEVGLGTANNKIAFVSGMGITGKGNDAVHAMNLCGLVIERSMRREDPPANGLVMGALGPAFALFKGTLGDLAADELWGKNYATGVLDGMDDDDEAILEADVGLEAEGGEKGVDLTMGATVHGREIWKKGVDEDGDPAFVKSSENELEAFAGLAVEFPPLMFAIDGSFTFPSVDDLDVSLKVGCGIDAAEMPEASVWGAGMRKALSNLEKLGRRLGTPVFGGILEESSLAFEAAVASEKALGRTYFQVSLDYGTRSGDLTVTVRGKTKIKKEEKTEEATFGVEADVGDVLHKSTTHVG